jgi:hypothetical protein
VAAFAAMTLVMMINHNFRMIRDRRFRPTPDRGVGSAQQKERTKPLALFTANGG